MQRITHLCVTLIVGMAICTLAACGVAAIPSPTPGSGAANSAAQTLPLRNELVSSIELVGKPGLFQTPWDAAPDPEGTTIYFTATGEQGAGVFKVPTQGGETTAVTVGEPFVEPLGLALSSDGQQVYVADAQAGQLFAVPATGGKPTPLTGTQGTTPQNLAVVQEAGADVIYFSGKDPHDGQPAVLKLSSLPNGTLSVVAKGAPLVQPNGIAITQRGVLYVADQLATGDGLGAVFRIENGNVQKIADHIRTGTPVVGASLTMDDSLLLVSALAQGRDSAQVLVIDLASSQQGVITKVVEANPGSGGIHRASKRNVFAWADSSIAKKHPGHDGGVYAIKP